MGAEKNGTSAVSKATEYRPKLMQHKPMRAISAKATQKLRQKSQLNSFDTNLGERDIILSRTPILSISKIKKAESRAINAASPKNVNIVITF